MIQNFAECWYDLHTQLTPSAFLLHSLGISGKVLSNCRLFWSGIILITIFAITKFADLKFMKK